MSRWDKEWGTLFRKPINQEDGGACTQKETVLPELNSGFFYTDRQGSKVKYFWVPISLQRGCVSCSGGPGQQTKVFFGLMPITWEQIPRHGPLCIIRSL